MYMLLMTVQTSVSERGAQWMAAPVKCPKDRDMLPGLADLGHKAREIRQSRPLPGDSRPVDEGHLPHVILPQIALSIPDKGYDQLRAQKWSGHDMHFHGAIYAKRGVMRHNLICIPDAKCNMAIPPSSEILENVRARTFAAADMHAKGG